MSHSTTFSSTLARSQDAATTYNTADHPWPLQPEGPGRVEHIHHSLRLQPLKENVDGDECSCSTTTTTREEEEEEVYSGGGNEDRYNNNNYYRRWCGGGCKLMMVKMRREGRGMDVKLAL